MIVSFSSDGEKDGRSTATRYANTRNDPLGLHPADRWARARGFEAGPQRMAGSGQPGPSAMLVVGDDLAGQLGERLAVFGQRPAPSPGGPVHPPHAPVCDASFGGEQPVSLHPVQRRVEGGPNSTELAIHLGFDRARWRGLVAAGVCFILPASLIVTALAWAYVTYGDTPAVEGILYGIVPAVIAIITHALLGLRRTVIKNRWLAALAVAAVTAYLLGINELLVLAAGAGLAAAAHLARHSPWRRQLHGLFVAPLLSLAGQPAFTDPSGGELAQLFGTMLKIGAVLYGSGYVLLAFLRGDFVDRLGWITEQQLIDAVSVGQVTPGPVFTTATFVGYLVAGPIGAFLATVAIFTPSFVFVGLLTRLTDKLRSSPWTSALLDGLTSAALALMAGVSYQLAHPQSPTH